MPLSERVERALTIGPNSAFNNRTKEELEMHMFEKERLFFPPPRLW